MTELMLLWILVAFLGLTVLGLTMFLIQNSWRWKYTGKDERAHLRHESTKLIRIAQEGMPGIPRFPR